MWYITALVFGVSLVCGLVYYARKEARKSARLEALKQEVRERQHAQNLIDNVRNMDDATVRDRLRELSKK